MSSDDEPWGAWPHRPRWYWRRMDPPNKWRIFVAAQVGVIVALAWSFIWDRDVPAFVGERAGAGFGIAFAVMFFFIWPCAVGLGFGAMRWMKEAERIEESPA